MSFLQPLFLLATAVVAVPLLLHLYHRRRGRPVVFPALRYLLRTEREHSRSIRLRQLLLLLLRVAVVLLLVLAGARLFLPGRGGAHHPTALAIVIDNSMSSARVVDEERVLDLLLDRARATLDRAGPDDRIWVIRAGEPWDPAPPGSVAAARSRVDSTRSSAAAGDLPAALRRARSLVASAGLAAAEVHLLSDLQATAFADGQGPADRLRDPAPGAALPPGAGEAPPEEGDDIPMIVYAAPAPTSPNRFVQRVEIGGGLPPLTGQRTEAAVRVGAGGGGGSSGGDGSDEPEPIGVRVVTGGQVRAAGSARPGDDVVLALGPFSGRTVQGWVEVDPDDLGADDRRWFVFEVRPPARVRREGDLARFLDDALGVLEEEGRVVEVEDGSAEVVLSVGGAGLDRRGGAATLVVPPADPALLPALNRRLADGGVPWRFDAPTGTGEAVVTESGVPVDLAGIRVGRYYRLVPSTGAGDAPVAPGEVTDAPVRLSTGAPFLVTGQVRSLAYTLLAAPADPEWTDLPVSAAMVPLLQWALTRHGRVADGDGRMVAGDPVPTPPSATAVRDPEGVVHPVDGTRSFRRTRLAGIYEVLAGDTVVERVALNAPVRESLLAPLDPDRLEEVLGPGARVVRTPGAWESAIFRSRRGSEPWQALLVGALALLLLESWMAASGASGSRREDRSGRGGTTGAARGASSGETPRSTRGDPDATVSASTR